MFSAAATVGLHGTFLAASLALPLQDGPIAAIDQAIGLDWATSRKFVMEHQWLNGLMTVIYFSLTPQVFLTVLLFSIVGDERRLQELFISSSIGLGITVLVFAMLPNLGPGGGLPEAEFNYSHILVAVREHGIAAAQLDGRGFIPFPSFHTVMALLLIRACRGTKLFLPIAAINVAMLVTISPIGGHYFIDIVAGMVVAAGSCYICGRVCRVTEHLPKWGQADNKAAARLAV